MRACTAAGLVYGVPQLELSRSRRGVVGGREAGVEVSGWDWNRDRERVIIVAMMRQQECDSLICVYTIA